MGVVMDTANYVSVLPAAPGSLDVSLQWGKKCGDFQFVILNLIPRHQNMDFRKISRLCYMPQQKT